MKVSDAELDQFITAHGMSICTRDQCRINILSGIVQWFEQCNIRTDDTTALFHVIMPSINMIRKLNGEPTECKKTNKMQKCMICCVAAFLLSVFWFWCVHTPVIDHLLPMPDGRLLSE